MTLRKPLPARCVLAAIAALLLALLTGCVSYGLDHAARNRSYAFGGVVAAHSHQGDLAVAYLAVGGWGRDTFVAWFTGQTLREGEAGLPPDSAVSPARLDGAPREVPDQAQPVPVVRLEPDQRELPALPPGTPMQVCYWPAGGPSPHLQQVLVLLRGERGAVIRRRVCLPCDRGLAWWYYPSLPVAVAVDIVTLPVQILFSYASCP